MTEQEKKYLLDRQTKRNQRICRDRCEYHYSNVRLPLTDIFQAYAKPSQAKQNAFIRCRNLCASLDGFDLHISGYSCDTFSVMFKFTVDGKLCYAYITAWTDRFCYV